MSMLSSAADADAAIENLRQVVRGLTDLDQQHHAAAFAIALAAAIPPELATAARIRAMVTVAGGALPARLTAAIDALSSSLHAFEAARVAARKPLQHRDALDELPGRLGSVLATSLTHNIPPAWRMPGYLRIESVSGTQYSLESAVIDAIGIEVV